MKINKEAEGVIIENQTLEAAFASNKNGDKGFFIKGKSKDVLKMLSRLKEEKVIIIKLL